MPDQNNGQNVGKIVEIKGVVIDAVFTDGLPEINTALRIEMPERDGQPAIELIAEVQQHLGDDRVRAVAMDATDGIPRGVDVIAVACENMPGGHAYRPGEEYGWKSVSLNRQAVASVRRAKLPADRTHQLLRHCHGRCCGHRHCRRSRLRCQTPRWQPFLSCLLSHPYRFRNRVPGAVRTIRCWRPPGVPLACLHP